MGGSARLPDSSVPMVRIAPVEGAVEVGKGNAKVYRNDRVGKDDSAGVSVFAAPGPDRVNAIRSCGQLSTLDSRLVLWCNYGYKH